MKIPFGKYVRWEFCNIPLDYLKWVEENCVLPKQLRDEINFEIKRRTGDRPGEGRSV